jgi:hypothetical protein
MLRRIKGRVCPDCRNMSNKINVINRYETQGHFHSFVLDSPRKKDLTSRVIAPILFSTGTVWRSTCKELCGEHWIHLKQRKQHSEQQTDDWLAAQSEALPLHSVRRDASPRFISSAQYRLHNHICVLILER